MGGSCTKEKIDEKDNKALKIESKKGKRCSGCGTKFGGILNFFKNKKPRICSICSHKFCSECCFYIKRPKNMGMKKPMQEVEQVLKSSSGSTGECDGMIPTK